MTPFAHTRITYFMIYICTPVQPIFCTMIFVHPCHPYVKLCLQVKNRFEDDAKALAQVATEEQVREGATRERERKRERERNIVPRASPSEPPPGLSLTSPCPAQVTEITTLCSETAEWLDDDGMKADRYGLMRARYGLVKGEIGC